MDVMKVVCRNFAFVLGLAIFGGCTSAPIQNVFNENRFLDGKTTLECGEFKCVSHWSSNASAMYALYEAGAWESLARKVTDIQYDYDLAYFYLARSAEGMGAWNAADIYYDDVRSARFTCSTKIIDTCNGIDVSAETVAGQKRLAIVDRSKPESLSMSLAEAQSRLGQIGLYRGDIDGISGPRTIEAIQSFQSSQGLPRSGALDTSTSRALMLVTRTPDRKYLRSENTSRSSSSYKPDDAPTPSSAPSSGTAKDAGRTRTKAAVEMLSEADPFAEVVIDVPHGAWVELLEQDGDWSRLRYKGQTGYVYSDTLE